MLAPMAIKKARQLDYDDLGKNLTRVDASGNTTSGLLESVSTGSWGLQVKYGEYTVSLRPDAEVDLI